MTTRGEQVIAWEDLHADDVVIVPAFGTTLEIQRRLAARGIDPYSYDTTCPFVEKVWNRTAQLGERDSTVVIHGTRNHEETRATFSHSRRQAPTVILQNMHEAEQLAAIVEGREPPERFEEWFREASSEGFDPAVHLQLVGVVNQTTMLASETQAIADRLRSAMAARYGEANIAEHFVDTRDTLCYATNENQSALLALAASGADLAVVVGGYNSSNTTHLVELAARSMPTYFVRDAEEMISPDEINHFDIHARERIRSTGWLSQYVAPVTIAISSGASCPDALVDEVLQKVVGWFEGARSIREVVEDLVG
jgi:4-hydroxy-3-methylbut-2-enyl diphosphate reductase